MPHRQTRPLEDYEPAELAHLCADPVFKLVCDYCGSATATPKSTREDPERPFLIHLEEDPDNRPYIWDLPEGCKCR